MSSSLSFIAAADTANMQAGGKSFFESAGDALTTGVVGAAVSGIHSIYNTGVDVSNKVFGTSLDRADTSRTMHEIDRSWGDYYDENKSAIDTVGFVGTSLVPGMLAVKGLKAVQAGHSFGTFGKVLGYTSAKEAATFSTALSELAIEGGTVFGRINKAKAASILWGTADNVLQTAAFEIATVATMKASPLLDNEEWGNIFKDMAVTSLTGGVIGGAIGGLIANGTYKQVGKAIEIEQRKLDVLKNSGTKGLSFGDDAMAITDALFELPEAALVREVVNPSGKALDIGSLMDKTLQNTTLRAVQKLEGKLTNVVLTDDTVGKPLANALVGILKEGLESKQSTETIRKELGNYLYNLHSVEGIGSRPTNLVGELQFFDATADFTKRLPMTSVRSQTATHAYRTVGDVSQAKVYTFGTKVEVNGKMITYQTEEEAFKGGFDLTLDPASKRMKVSPFSEVYKEIPIAEADYNHLFLNTRTKQTSETVIPTIADIATKAVPLKTTIGGVQSGNKSFSFNTAFKALPTDSVEATARHAWASALPKIFGTVDTRDISLMEALMQDTSKATPGLMIHDAATGVTKAFDDLHDVSAAVFKAKYAQAKELLADPKADLRDIGYKLNVSPEWIQDNLIVAVPAKTAFNTPGWAQPLKAFNERENLLLRYNKEAMDAAQAFPDSRLAFDYRVQAAKIASQDASSSVLGKHYKDLPDLEGDITKTADSIGTGATLFGASNANYADKLKAMFQYVGQQVSKITDSRVNEALTELQPYAAKVLANPASAAEISAAVTKARLSTEPMAIYTDGLTGKRMLVDLESYKAVMHRGAVPAFKTVIPLSEDAGNFLATHHSLHNKRIDQQKVLGGAQGQTINWDPDKLYMPPVDTQRVPFFAFVRQTDGTIFGSSEVAMITARDAKELTAKAAAVEKDNPGLRVIYKKDTEEFHKAKASYDFERTMNEPVIDSTLRSQGKLGDYLPNMNPEAVVSDFVQYTQRAETKIVRDAVSVKYGQQFAELQDLSDRYTAPQQSLMRGITKESRGSLQDPFGDYMKLALNISKRGEFTLLHQANEFVDALGTRAYRGVEKALIDARGGQISWQEANDQLTKFGLGKHFTDEEVFKIAQSGPDRNILQTAVQKANMILATGMLRLDQANSLLNIISTPILLSTELSSIRQSMKKDPALSALFDDMTSVRVPGTEVKIPSAKKIIYNAVNSYFTDKTGLMQRFKDIGTVKGPTALFHEMSSDLSLLPSMAPSKYAEKVTAWVDTAAKYSGSDFAEDFTRYVTSHAMFQVTEPVRLAGKMSVQEQNAYMSIFTNRVQGNYVASQRPIAFQGTIGSAIGLFQTYQFNLFQQLFRHIENKDLKTIATMGALQGTLYGANGLPLFDAINTHIVGNASINEKHNDAYSFAVQAAGKEYGEWLMYGTASAFPMFSDKAPALWTRGDLNPRSVFILPTSPLDVPAVAASLKVVNNVLSMAKQIGNGGDVSDTLLFGLEHNGLNRPLAGLAQALKGTATTSKGDLISASSDLFSIANASRIIGAKPMDESIALTAAFRSKSYQAHDKASIDDLGIVIKEKLRNNQTIDSEDWIDLQSKYAASGGRIDGFTKAIQRWDVSANRSLANEVMRHTETAAGQRMIQVLGGDPLPDFENQPAD